MMKCASCDIDFNDGVQCTSCLRHLDFGCASITEAGWRKLGNDRRAVWRCPKCRISSPSLTPSPSPAPAPEGTVSLDTVLSEIREIKAQLAGLPSLTRDVKCIKEELKELRTSNEFESKRLDDFSVKIAGIESRVVGLEQLQESVCSLQSDVDFIKSELSASDQRTRLNNVEIKGIPIKKDENLFTVLDKISQKVNFTFPKTQINYISRIPLFNTKDKAIVVSFLNRYVKEDFVAAARSVKTLSTLELGFEGQSNRVYVNDHLNADSKKLLNKTRALAKDREFKYVWVKHGKIHVRKQEGSAVLVISNEKDLNKLN